MKRVLSLVLALVLVLGMMPTFAADATGADNLKAYGFISGNESGDLMVGSQLTRAEMAVVLSQLFGVKDAAENYAVPANFSDVSTHWAKNYIAYGQAANWFSGYNGMYDPDGIVSQQQLAAYLLNALGYTYEYSQAVELCATIGIDVPAGSALLRGEAFEAVWAAVNTPKLGSDVALGVELGKLEAPVVAPTTLEVVSVSALNAKQIEVVFNKPVDSDTINLNNFDVSRSTDASGTDRLASATETAYNVAQTINTGSADVQPDGKTVLLTLDNGAKLANPSSIVNVKVAGVKDLEGNTIATVTKTTSMTDSTVPSVVSIETFASNVIRITFSEPVTAVADADDDGLDAADFGTNDFVVDSYAYAVTGVLRGAEANQLDVTLSGNLSDGQHSIVVNNANEVMDYAGYTVVKETKTFTTVKDVTVPSFTAEARNERTVRLTFSKPVSLTTAGSNVHFRYAYNSTNAMQQDSADVDGITAGAQALTAVAGSNGMKYDVVFANPMNPGNATIFVTYITDTNAAGRLVDGFGNVLESGSSATCEVVADTTAPTVTGVTVVNATTIDVTYSEAVVNANISTNYTLTSPTGANMTVTSAALKAGTTSTYRLTVQSMAAGGSFGFAINNNIRDLSVAANRLVAYTSTLAVEDLTAPTLLAYTIDTARTTIYLEFSEPMIASGTFSALDVNNYRTATVGTVQSTLPTGSTITQEGKVVKIALPSALAASEVNIVVGQVADLAGNTMASLQTSVTMVSSDNFTATISSSKFTARDTITFKVNRHLSAIDATKIRTTGVAATATSATYVNGTDGKAVVTATFAANTFATDLAGLSTIELDANAVTDLSGLTSNALSSSLTAADLLAKDYIAPSIVSRVAVDSDANGQIDQIKVTYSENLYVPSVVDADYVVSNYDILSVSVSGAVVTITVDEKATSDLLVTPDVQQVGTVADASDNRNEKAAESAVTAASASATTAATATLTSATVITLNVTAGTTAKYVIGASAANYAALTAGTAFVDGATLADTDVADTQHLTILTTTTATGNQVITDYVITEVVPTTVTAVTLQ